MLGVVFFLMFTIAKNAETKLVEIATTLKDDPSGYYALYFRFSRLEETRNSLYQVKIAINILLDLFKGEEGGVFLCKDNDVFFLYKGTNRPLIEKSIFQLRYLFADDPLAYTASNRENEEFCAVYDLEFQCAEFIKECKVKATGMAVVDRKAPAPVPKKSDEVPPSYPTSSLSRLEADLPKLDIRHTLRKQPICAVVEGKSIQPVFHETYIHIAHLKRLLPYSTDFTSNMTLFKYFTELLDMEVIGLIKQQPRFYFREAASINLNVISVLSRTFEELNRAIPDELRSSIIIEIPIADVFCDYAAFLTARHFLQKHGYRLCLDGLNSLSFVQLDRDSLGFDLVKLQWNADIESHLSSEENQILRYAIEQCGVSRVILCRCDSKYAIDYGKNLGISLFQGRHLDRILNPNAKVEN